MTRTRAHFLSPATRRHRWSDRLLALASGRARKMHATRAQHERAQPWMQKRESNSDHNRATQHEHASQHTTVKTTRRRESQKSTADNTMAWRRNTSRQWRPGLAPPPPGIRRARPMHRRVTGRKPSMATAGEAPTPQMRPTSDDNTPRGFSSATAMAGALACGCSRRSSAVASRSPTQGERQPALGDGPFPHGLGVHGVGVYRDAIAPPPARARARHVARAPMASGGGHTGCGHRCRHGHDHPHKCAGGNGGSDGGATHTSESAAPPALSPAAQPAAAWRMAGRARRGHKHARAQAQQ